MRILAMAVVGGALALVLAGATAEATDQCYSLSPGGVYVARALTLPAANNCKPVSGYVNETTSTIAGSVCKSKNNGWFYFNLQINIATLGAQMVTFNVNATTPNGSGIGRILTPTFGASLPGGFTDVGVTKVACPADRFFAFE